MRLGIESAALGIQRLRVSASCFYWQSGQAQVFFHMINAALPTNHISFCKVKMNVAESTPLIAKCCTSACYY